MERTYIADIKNNLGKPVLVQGFVENLRDSKYMAFIVLKDITGKIQITVEKEKLPELKLFQILIRCLLRLSGMTNFLMSRLSSLCRNLYLI